MEFLKHTEWPMWFGYAAVASSIVTCAMKTMIPLRVVSMTLLTGAKRGRVRLVAGPIPICHPPQRAQLLSVTPLLISEMTASPASSIEAVMITNWRYPRSDGRAGRKSLSLSSELAGIS